MSTAGEKAAPASRSEVTRLLQAWGSGDLEALQQLMPFVYNELHRLAHHYMTAEQSAQILQTTALVHEVYLPPQRLRNLQVALDEYLRFGLEAGVIVAPPR